MDLDLDLEPEINQDDVWGVDRDEIKRFLTDFVSTDRDGTQHKKYMELMTDVANRKIKQLPVSLDDIDTFLGDDFSERTQQNILRYETLFCQQIDALLPEPTEEFDPINSTSEDVIIEHRRMEAVENGHNADAALFRRFSVVFQPPSEGKQITVRNLKASHIGSLVKVKAIVTRTTDVKPKLTYAVYRCALCEGETIQRVTTPQFMPLQFCPGENCSESGSRSKAKLSLLIRGSRFVKYQELRIQELAHQVPVGHTPRAMTVHAQDGATRIAKPGDVVEITGCYLPTVLSGFNAIRVGLVAGTYLQAHDIKLMKQQGAAKNVVSDEMRAKVLEFRQDEDWYDKLAQSIAPEIFGHEDIKKALILSLAGGSARALDDGMKIRGDINICLMGDPGVAKSQLLRHLCSLSPRGIYTTGRGSSGVGLTAAITRDVVTDELVLEGGALVLADEGVCAIDEFDKMDESDRTAIYEVMEQQTISIAKAGITTTLNARAAILAAANPLYGRYNVSKSITENINLPTALLSRFDLLFLLLDRPDNTQDRRLAEHVAHVHTNLRPPELGFEPVDGEMIRAYMIMAKELTPTVPARLAERIVEEYSLMRQQHSEQFGIKATPRSLLAILRLSTARARLRFAPAIEEEDVDEAFRLINVSKASLEDMEKNTKKRNPGTIINDIFDIVRNLLERTPHKIISYDKAKKAVLGRDFTQSNFEMCLNSYIAAGVLIIDDSNTVIKFAREEMDE